VHLELGHQNLYSSFDPLPQFRALVQQLMFLMFLMFLLVVYTLDHLVFLEPI
jgi:hypothetical protein